MNLELMNTSWNEIVQMVAQAVGEAGTVDHRPRLASGEVVLDAAQ